MKVIDILNKIANNEEVPKKIMYDEVVFEFINGVYKSEEYYLEEFLTLNLSNLNDKVEILETTITGNKGIEKIDVRDFDDLAYNDGSFRETEVIDTLLKIQDKINELIDEVNKLKEVNKNGM